jgi:hypothetical protein
VGELSFRKLGCGDEVHHARKKTKQTQKKITHRSTAPASRPPAAGATRLLPNESIHAAREARRVDAAEIAHSERRSFLSSSRRASASLVALCVIYDCDCVSE